MKNSVHKHFYLLLLPVFMALFCCKKQKNAVPALDFNYSGIPNVGYLITFSSNITNAGTYLWVFGDGAESTDPKPNHTYYSAASFSVTLIINNDVAHKVTKTIVVGPAFDFTYSGSPAAGYPLVFSSTAPSGASYLWRFGDGTVSADATPTHVFATNGSYNVSLIINNDSSYIISKPVNIFADGIYLGLIPGTRTWHHTYTDAMPWPPYHTLHTMADVVMTITGIGPELIAVGADTLVYNGTSNSDSVLVFMSVNQNANDYSMLYFNHFTSAISYYDYVHISAAAGDANDHYYTP